MKRTDGKQGTICAHRRRHKRKCREVTKNSRAAIKRLKADVPLLNWDGPDKANEPTSCFSLKRLVLRPHAYADRPDLVKLRGAPQRYRGDENYFCREIRRSGRTL